MRSSRAPARARRTLALLTATALAAALAGSAVAAPGGRARQASAPKSTRCSSRAPTPPQGVVIDPIISVGDQLDSGFMFDSIPDGISLVQHGKGRVDLYVNHETSLVPFPGTLTDYTNSHVDLLGVNQWSAGVLDGVDAIPSDANFQRFCSNFLATAEQGFDRPILFANEEATDIVNRVGLAWPAPSAFGSQPEQAGVVVALDIESGEYRAIYGMGRHNHENSVAIRGYDDLVVLSGDDTFSAPASQLYSYIAADTDAVWDDEGALWAFVGEDGLQRLRRPRPRRRHHRRIHPGPARCGDRRPERPGELVEREQRVPVHPDRGHRLRPGRPTRRVLRRHGRAAGHRQPGDRTARSEARPARWVHTRTAGSSGWCSTTPTRPRSTACPILIDADPLGPGNPLAMHQPDNLERPPTAS